MADPADRPGISEIYNLRMGLMDLSASRQLTALRKALRLDEPEPPSQGVRRRRVSLQPGS